jgi:hypothetical protein
MILNRCQHLRMNITDINCVRVVCHVPVRGCGNSAPKSDPVGALHYQETKFFLTNLGARNLTLGRVLGLNPSAWDRHASLYGCS